MSSKQDQREVARTVSLLERTKASRGVERDPVEDALALHRIAGSLHRYDERQCCEDLTCPTCRGDGQVREDGQTDYDCPKCGGSGLTIGKRVANLEAKAVAIASAYGFRAYFQGDPRGCPLYLIPEADIPVVGRELDYYANGVPTDHATLQARWIASNYSSRGVAIVWLG